MKKADIPQLNTPLAHLEHRLKSRSERLIIALAGLPGGGKSTWAKQLIQQVQQQLPEYKSICLGMDGFHLSKAELAKLPDPERAFARRGAQWTFDAKGFVDRIKQLRAATSVVQWPDFAHDVGDPIVDAFSVATDCQLIIIEGLYVAYREDDWVGLDGLFDEVWYLDTPEAQAYHWLLNRHQQAWGISAEAAAERIASSDGKNAALVKTTRANCDWRVIPEAV